METFQKYWLTITICSIFFAVYIIYEIIKWREEKKKEKKDDEIKSYCPDYWTIGSESKNKVVCVPPSQHTGFTAKKHCLKHNKTFKTTKNKKDKCQWAKNCDQQWYGVWDDNNTSC